MRHSRRATFALLLALAAPVAPAPGVEPPADAVAAYAVHTRPVSVPADTELLFEMGEDVSSKTSQRGDRFPLRLAEPLRIDGYLLVPAGTPAMGEVVHADRAKGGGQAGELILAARHLEWDGRQLPLRAFGAGVGKNRTKSAMGVSLAAGVAGMLVRGGNIEMPAGSLITARLREATELPVVPEPATPATPATPNTNDVTTGEHQE